MLSSAWYKAVLSHMIYSMLFMPPFCVFRKKVLVAIHTLIFSDHNLEQFSIKSYTVFFVKKWELIRLKPFIIYSCLQFAFLFPCMTRTERKSILFIQIVLLLQILDSINPVLLGVFWGAFLFEWYFLHFVLYFTAVEVEIRGL